MCHGKKKPRGPHLKNEDLILTIGLQQGLRLTLGFSLWVLSLPFLQSLRYNDELVHEASWKSGPGPPS